MKCVLRTLCVVLLLKLGSVTIHAQSTEVQELYQQAHEAQQAGDVEKAINIYHQLLRKDASIAPAYNNLGRLYFNQNRFGEAAAILQKGVALKPDMAPAQVMLGASYLELSQPDKAVEPLRLGVEGLPDDPFARRTFAQALLQTHRTEQAAEQLHKLVQIDPKDQRSWYLLGKLELELSQEDFARMQAVDPNSPLSHQLSGEIMESMQNTPGALTEYKQALALDPNNADALFHLADLYWSTADWQKAEPALRQYLSKKPGDCRAEWKLANALSQFGSDSNEQLALASAAVHTCPGIPQAHAERARALLKNNQPKEALADLRSAEADSPSEPSLQFLYAKAYHALGDETKAKASMARFQELDRAEHAAQEKRTTDVLGATQ